MFAQVLVVQEATEANKDGVSMGGLHVKKARVGAVTIV